MECRLGADRELDGGAYGEAAAAICTGEDGIEDLYRGEVKREKETLAVFAADEELQEAVGKWVERGKYGKLLELWAKGLSFDWSSAVRRGQAAADLAADLSVRQGALLDRAGPFRPVAVAASGFGSGVLRSAVAPGCWRGGPGG